MATPRIDIRPKVRAAIVSHFVANAAHAFHAGLGGRFAYGRAVQGWTLPFAVFTIPTVRRVDTFGAQIDHLELRVEILGRTSVQVEELCSACLNLFEGRFYAADGLEPFQLEQSFTIGTTDESEKDLIMWHGGVEMDALIEVT